MQAGGRRTRAGRWAAVAAGAACALASPGCGPGLYLIDVLPASAAVHGADQAGADEDAPYEFWTAHAYLEKAAEEANEGNYQDAFRFASHARQMGERAQRVAAERRREARQAATSAPRGRAGAASSGEGADR